MKCKCKQCAEYVNKESGVKTPAGFFCCFDHAIQFANEKSRRTAERQAAKERRVRQEKEKEARKAHRERKVELKNVPWHRNRAKRTFQDWRRISLICEFLERGEQPKCFTCGTEVTIRWEAGHYRPAGVNSAIMFEPINVQLQCHRCNQELSGNLTPYRINLVKLYGESTVVALENNHEVKHWTREEFTQITETYRLKLSELKKTARFIA